jgi:hypothetical protein
MNTTSQLAGSLLAALEHPTHGVVGLVDVIFRLCPEHGLELDWHAGRCRIRSWENGSENLLDACVRKSVFRAILARIAALCNEQGENPVSPYGGQAKLCIGVDRPASYRVKFVNTNDEQILRILPSANGGSLHEND